MVIKKNHIYGPTHIETFTRFKFNSVLRASDNNLQPPHYILNVSLRKVLNRERINETPPLSTQVNCGGARGWEKTRESNALSLSLSLVVWGDEDVILICTQLGKKKIRNQLDRIKRWARAPLSRVSLRSSFFSVRH